MKSKELGAPEARFALPNSGRASGTVQFAVETAAGNRAITAFPSGERIAAGPSVQPRSWRSPGGAWLSYCKMELAPPKLIDKCAMKDERWTRGVSGRCHSPRG